MATYSALDQQNAFSYAIERLRQEAISRLKMEGPLTYAFINIKVEPDGWKEKAGVMTEPGQKLAPYRAITYDTSKLDCSAFSCIAVDMLKHPQEGDKKNTHAAACVFAAQTSTSFPVKDPQGNEVRRLVACGPGCFRRLKKRDPHTGQPTASGTLMGSYINPVTGERICHHMNQGLIMWAAVPWSRPGKIKQGYNTVHVPGMAFGDEEGNYSQLNNVQVSRNYCNFFKQYYDDEVKECYQSGWMKFVKFMFGQYFANVSYELAHGPPTTHGSAFNCWEFAFGRALYRAGAATTNNEFDNIVQTRPLIVKKPIIHTPDEQVNENIVDQELVMSLMDPSPSSRGGQKSSEKIMETSDAILDTALQLELLGLSDKQARHILLKELYKGSRLSTNKGGFANVSSFSQALKLVGITLATRKALFSKEATVRRKGCANYTNIPHRWSACDITERDALLVAKVNMEAAPEYQRPRPFLDVIPIDNSNEDKTTSAFDIWVALLKKYSHEFTDEVSSTIKGLVVSTVRQLLDIMEGKIFLRGNKWENNVPLMLGFDAILRRLLSSAASMCKNIVKMFEKRVFFFASEVVSKIPTEAVAVIASRTLGLLLEESTVKVIMAAAVRTAIQAFVALAEIAGSIITALGVVLFLVAILGMVLDYALSLGWYNTVLDTDSIKKVINTYETAFANATNTDIGQTSPVTAEELVGVDMELQIDEEDRMRADDGEDKLIEYLDNIFRTTPLLPKSRAIFLQEGVYEYLSGRTMNSLGQRLVNNSDPEGDHGLSRSSVTETANLVEDYSKVVDYNMSKLDYVGDEWARSLAVGSSAGDSDALFRKIVTYSAVAGFSLVAGLGVLIATHVSFIRGANIGMAFAFIGLLMFITMAGVVYLNIVAMGESNALAIEHIELVGEKQNIYKRKRTGAVQRLTSSGAKFNIISDFIDPLLMQVQ
uniref:Wsv115-like protein n=1 Tax=Chionoecetes opilio bacilliform virus TaxID=1825681 RepID=A0A1Q3DL90_9VIRU|nr:hypothetical protein SCV_025 [Chionoecetes opilio bacilliform virus]